MAAGQAIASGAVILTANADGLAQGLQRSQASVIDWGNRTANDAAKASAKIGGQVEQSFEHTQSKLNKAFGKFAKHEGGFLGAIGGGVVADLGMTTAAASIAGIVLAMQQIGKLTDEAGGFSRDFAKELERGKIASDDLVKSMDRIRARAAEQTALIANPFGRAEALDQDIKTAEGDLAGFISQVRSAQKDIEDLGKFKSFENFHTYISPFADLEKLTEEPKANLARANAEASKLRDQLAGMRQERFRLLHPEQDLKLMAEFEAKLKQLNDSMVQLGMKPWEKELMDKFEGRLPAEKLKMMRELGIAADAAAEKFKNAEEAAADLEKRATYVPLAIMTGWKLLDATLKGFADKKLIPGGSFDLSNLVKTPEPTKFAPAILKGSLEDYTLSVKSQFGDMGKTTGDKQTDAIKEGNKRLDKAVDRLENIDKKLGDWEVI